MAAPDRASGVASVTMPWFELAGADSSRWLLTLAVLRGVPSTGQKLNLSANSSWQVEQNFIAKTSLSILGRSIESFTTPARSIARRKLDDTRLSSDSEGPGACHLSSKSRSASSDSNL